jgi:hypothetical protein
MDQFLDRFPDLAQSTRPDLRQHDKARALRRAEVSSEPSFALEDDEESQGEDDDDQR